MARNNAILGIAAGAALVGAAYVLSKKGKLNFHSVIDEAENLITGIRNKIGMGNSTEDDIMGESAHDGRHLAEKVRHRVERNLAAAKK